MIYSAGTIVTPVYQTLFSLDFEKWARTDGSTDVRTNGQHVRKQ